MKTKIRSGNPGEEIEIEIEYRTVVAIRRGVERGVGVVRCSDHDRFSRTQGMKLALAKAFLASGMAGPESKSERRLIWQNILRANERRKVNSMLAEKLKSDARLNRKVIERIRRNGQRAIGEKFSTPAKRVPHGRRNTARLNSSISVPPILTDVWGWKAAGDIGRHVGDVAVTAEREDAVAVRP